MRALIYTIMICLSMNICSAVDQPKVDDTITFPILPHSSDSINNLKIVNSVITGLEVNNLTPVELIAQMNLKLDERICYPIIYNLDYLGDSDVHDEGIRGLLPGFYENPAKGPLDEYEGVQIKINWGKLPPITAGDLIDKLCDEVKCKWRFQRSSIYIEPQNYKEPLYTSSYTVDPSFIKTVVNFPHLKNSETELKDIPLTQENLQKGLVRLGVYFNKVPHLPFRNYALGDKNSITYDSVTKKLSIVSNNSGAVDSLDRLVSMCNKEPIDFESFCSYLKFEYVYRHVVYRRLDLNESTLDELVEKLVTSIEEVAPKCKGWLKVESRIHTKERKRTMSLRFANMPVDLTLNYIIDAGVFDYKVVGNKILIYEHSNTISD